MVMVYQVPFLMSPQCTRVCTTPKPLLKKVMELDFCQQRHGWEQLNDLSKYTFQLFNKAEFILFPNLRVFIL